MRKYWQKQRFTKVNKRSCPEEQGVPSSILGVATLPVHVFRHLDNLLVTGQVYDSVALRSKRPVEARQNQVRYLAESFLKKNNYLRTLDHWRGQRSPKPPQVKLF